MADRPSLALLMNRYGTDKLHVHHYDGEYGRHFGPLRDEPVRLLEIGIGGYNCPGRGGESLKVWRDYFPAGKIFGLDVENKDWLDAGRIFTIRGSQDEPDLLRGISSTYGPFDIVIDDGSHRQAHILTSFETLFPLLKPGGIYVIEDMATAYHPGYGGDPTPLLAGWIACGNDDVTETSVSLVARLIDGLHWQSWKGRTPTDIQRMVKSVHVSKELAFIYKA